MNSYLAALILPVLFTSTPDHGMSDWEVKCAALQLPGEFDQALTQHHVSTARSPHILLIVLDTLRADYAASGRMPNLGRVLRESTSAQINLAAATSTDHALFSLFYMRPAFERELALTAGWKNGSPALRLLAAAGYHINLFAYPHWYACPPTQLLPSRPPSPWSNTATFGLFYGQKGELLTRCPHRGEHDVSVTDYNAADRALVEQYLAFVEDEAVGAEPPNEPRFDILHLYGMHDPYGVDTSLAGLQKPWWPQLADRRAHCSPQGYDTAVEREMLRNTYANAASSLDVNLGNLFAGLEANGLLAEMLVVIMSDHGEKLPTRAGEPALHGHDPDQEQIRVVNSFKFPKSNPAVIKANIGSTTSLFPTLFDYLGLHSQPLWPVNSIARAPSLLATPTDRSDCFISVRPRQALPPNRFVVTRGEHQALLQIKERCADGLPSQITILAISNSNGEQLPESLWSPLVISPLLLCLSDGL